VRLGSVLGSPAGQDVSGVEDPIFRRRADRPWRRLALGLLLALLVHGLFGLGVLGLALLGLLTGPRVTVNQPESVALMNVPASQWEANRSVGNRPPAPPGARSQPAPVPRPLEKKPEAMPKGQVVDVAPGNDQKPADDAKYLAEHDNTVARESRAKDQTAFYKNAMPRRTTTLPPSQATGHDNTDKATVRGNQGLGQDEREKSQGKAAAHFDVPTTEKRDRLAVIEQGKHGELRNQTESEGVRGNANRLRITPGEAGSEGAEVGSEGRLGDRNVANLMPSASTLDKIAGAAPNDHLSQVDEGNGTFLNTREFKYATFFNRVKQSVGEHWDPSAPLRQRDPEGRIYAYKDRYTMLAVTLDTSGHLKQVVIDKSCGVDFLDQEAVAAFERAQPFPNPPPGLADHGEVHFAFGFFLEVSAGSNLRLFRSRD
jgi:TonB family protein